MVNKYKRKTQQASWSEATMRLAMEEAKTTSVSAAAKKYGITLSTLQRHLKKGTSEKKLGRYQRVFNDVQENELLEYVFQVDDLFYGLTKTEFLKLAYQYAEKNNIVHPFKDGIAGNDWYLGFKKRHPNLTVRQPEPTSIARARGFNRPQVYRFYDLLETEIDKHGVDATRIYNMDETGIQTTSNKPPKILSRTGKKQVGVIASAERGKLTTVICCCNAAGSFIPPFLIYGRKRMVGRLLDGAPPGSNATCTDNGWINGPKFLEWLRHFVEITRPTPEKKVVLVMDNHESHKFLEALEYATKHNVIFISLPPHTTHRMQPLDCCVYGPFKTYFEQAISTFQRSHVGRIISQYDVARLFSDAYLKAATPNNAIKGFESTGIWPTNRHIFCDADFLPSSLTDRAPGVESSVNDESHLPADEGRRVFSDSNRTVSPSILESVDNVFVDHCIDTNRSQDIFEEETTPNNENIPPDAVRASCSTPVSANLQAQVHPSTPVIVHVKPIDIRPTPTLSPNKTNRKRKIQRAEVLTSTPIKEQQKEKEEKRKRSTNKVGVMRNLKNLPSTSKINKTTKKASSKKKPEKQYYCIICRGLYVNPPKEDWIKCADCEEWAHEACTSYSGIGSYYCDLCQE